MIEVKRRREKKEREANEPKHIMVNIRVSEEEHAWLTEWADEISEATNYAPSISGALRLLLQEAMKSKPKIKVV